MWNTFSAQSPRRPYRLLHTNRAIVQPQRLGNVLRGSNDMWTLLRIALRNVSRNRRRTLITLAALLIGVGALVSIRGLMNGLQHGLIDGVVKSQTGAIQ